MTDNQQPEWVVTYQFDGSQFGLTIRATDDTEASRRLRAIGMTGRITGKVTDGHGDTWPEWAAGFDYDGGAHHLTLPARDRDEAGRRLAAIGRTGVVDGKLVMTIPAGPGAGLFVRAVTALRNLVARAS